MNDWCDKPPDCYRWFAAMSYPNIWTLYYSTYMLIVIMNIAFFTVHVDRVLVSISIIKVSTGCNVILDKSVKRQISRVVSS
jgi:hypothetical protein